MQGRLRSSDDRQENRNPRRMGQTISLSAQSIAVLVGQAAARAPGFIRLSFIVRLLSFQVRPVEALKQLAAQSGEVAAGQQRQTPAEHPARLPVFPGQFGFGEDGMTERL